MSEILMENSGRKNVPESHFFTPEKNMPFYLSSVGKSDLSYLYNIAPKNPRDARLIGWVLSGSGTVEDNGKSFNLYPQDVFIFSSDKERVVKENPKNPLVLLWVAVGGDFVDSVFDLFSLDEIVHFSNIIISYNIEAILNQASSVSDEDEFLGHCSVHFMDIVQKLYIHNKKMRKEQKALSTPEKMKEIIDSSSSYDLSMTELAEKVFCSRNHAIRLFKERFGVSPYKYISEARLKNAEKMLKGTNLSITEIAKKLSFCDSRYFSNWFRAQKNISPKAYRQNLSGK